MHTFHRTTATLLTIISLVLTQSSDHTSTVSTDPVITDETTEPESPSTAAPAWQDGVPVGAHIVFGANEEDLELLEAATSAFHNARLPLPDLAIHFHDNLAKCDGFGGTYRQHEDRIDLCSRTRRSPSLRHELAHAWEHHSVDDTTREAFMESQGLSTWWNPDVEWEDRGGEQAAETIAKGLIDRPYPDLDVPAIDELEADFVLLTGHHSQRYLTSPRRNQNN